MNSPHIKDKGTSTDDRSGLLVSLLTPLTNRGADGKFSLPSDGWYHGLPKGTFQHVEELPGGVIRIADQVIDDAALVAMKNSFDAAAANPTFPGLLVDFDHFSGDPDKSTEAAGWITAWQNRSGPDEAPGAWWQIRWSDTGEPAVRNGRFRFISGEFLPSDCDFIKGPIKNEANRTITMTVRPRRLASAALTNKPNLRGMVPLSNRQGASASPADNQPPPTNNKQSMKSIATKLGLSAEASEDAILDAVTKIITNREDLVRQLRDAEPFKNRITELELQVTQLTDEQIDQDLSSIKDEAKRAALKPVLKPMKNREARLAFLKTVIDSTAVTKPLTNRAGSKTPADRGASAAGDEQDEVKIAEQREKELRDYRIRNRCTNAEAWDAVRRDKPELFGIVRS